MLMSTNFQLPEVYSEQTSSAGVLELQWESAKVWIEPEYGAFHSPCQLSGLQSIRTQQVSHPTHATLSLCATMYLKG